VVELSEALNKANESIIALADDEEILAQNIDKSVKEIVKFAKKELKKGGHDLRIKIQHNLTIVVYVKNHPEGIVGKIVKALMDLVEAMKTVIEKVPELLEQIIDLAKDVAGMPGKIQATAMSGGLNPMQIAKAVKNTGLNVKYAAGAPNDIKELIHAVKELSKTLDELAKDEEVDGDEKGENEKGENEKGDEKDDKGDDKGGEEGDDKEDKDDQDDQDEGDDKDDKDDKGDQDDKEKG